MTALRRALMAAAGRSSLTPAEAFSTDLYTGNGSTQSIVNGIDLDGKGGLVWLKNRSNAADHVLHDTVRGNTKILNTNSTAAQDTATAGTNVTSFNSDGYSLGTNYSNINTNGQTYAAWTFRRAPKFFDVVTYTGNGTSDRQIAHSLGTSPGLMIVKSTTDTERWTVYHRSDPTNIGDLSETFDFMALVNGFTTAPTASEFTVGSNDRINSSGQTFIAYLFAHDTSASGIVQCGSYTGNGSSTGPVINLGWEPQWLLTKRAIGGYDSWWIRDAARGGTTGNDDILIPNASAAEQADPAYVVDFTSSGFQIKSTNTAQNNSGDTYVYLAIRAES